MDLKSKLELLRELYPQATAEVLKELLESCGGSLTSVKDLLGESDTRRAVKRRRSNDPGATACSIPLKATKTEPNTNSTRIPVVMKPQTDVNSSHDALNGESKPSKAKVDLRDVLRGENISTENIKSVTLTSAEEVERHLPCARMYRNFLPQDLCNDLTEALVSKRMMFQDKEIYIAGQLCRPSQRSVMFCMPEHMKLENSYTSNNMHHAEFFPELYMAKAWVDQKVTEVVGSRPRESLQWPHEWRGDICVANHYETNRAHLDMHADKLTNLGPLPAIASISLGATRLFRMRRNVPGSTIFNIPLAHNTLMIMLPGAQETFKHGVPTLKNSLVALHPTLQAQRYNLTFRMVHPKLKRFPVHCDRCSERMVLRRARTGQYIWRCFSSYKGGACNRVVGADLRNLNGDPEDAKLVCKEGEQPSEWHEKW